MTHWKKLLIPIGFGILAMWMNATMMSQRLNPIECVCLVEGIERGEVFDEKKLGRLELSGNIQSLPGSVIPWSERAILYNRPATRDLQAGDVVLWRDTNAASELSVQPGEAMFPVALDSVTKILPDFIHVDQEVGFFLGQGAQPSRTELKSTTPQLEYLGPFRVIAVGRRVTPSGDHAGDGRGDDRVLTVAIRFLGKSRQPDELSSRLIAATSGFGSDRILGVVLHPQPNQRKPT